MAWGSTPGVRGGLTLVADHHVELAVVIVVELGEVWVVCEGMHAG